MLTKPSDLCVSVPILLLLTGGLSQFSIMSYHTYSVLVRAFSWLWSEIFTKVHLKLYTVSHRIPGPGCVRWTNGLDKGFVGLQPRYLLSHQTELNFKPLRKLEFGPPSQQKEIIRCIHATTTTTPCPCPQLCIQRILLISSLNSHQDLLCKDIG